MDRGYCMGKYRIMKKRRLQSSLSFHLMSMKFHFRDWLRPPIKILLEAGVRSGMTVLDFGCGPGGFSLAAARIIGTEGMVYALDIHPLAIKSVRRAAAEQDLGNIRAMTGNSMSEIHRQCLDFALLYDVLHDIQYPVPALVEINRVLKPKGVLSVSDHHLKEASLLSIVTGSGLFRFTKSNRWTFQFERTETSEVAT